MKRSLLIGLFFLSNLSLANDFKFGYVDVNEIFTKSAPAIALKEALNIKLSPIQNELKELNDTLAKENNDIGKITDPNKLSSKDKVKINKFQQDKLLFQQKYMALQQNTQKLQDYASGLLLSKVNDILKVISDDGNYDLVMTSNQLVYTKPKYNLTDQVIVRLKNIDTKSLVKQLDEADAKINSDNQKFMNSSFNKR